MKWLQTLTLADTRANSPFTKRWYLDPDATGDRTLPVWRTAVQSVIVSPSPEEANLTPHNAINVWGWAWGDEGVDRVLVSTDGGRGWEEAALEPQAGHAWRRFRYEWRPSAAGLYKLASKATSMAGVVQPGEGRRNAVYSIEIVVGEQPHGDTALRQ